MNGSDRTPGGSYRATARGQSDFPGGVGGIKRRTDRRDMTFELFANRSGHGETAGDG